MARRRGRGDGEGGGLVIRKRVVLGAVGGEVGSDYVRNGDWELELELGMFMGGFFGGGWGLGMCECVVR